MSFILHGCDRFLNSDISVRSASPRFVVVMVRISAKGAVINIFVRWKFDGVPLPVKVREKSTRGILTSVGAATTASRDTDDSAQTYALVTGLRSIKIHFQLLHF